LISVGITHSKEIIKNDKTNEYLELNARKASLQKTLTSLIEFKSKNGAIDEFMNLENRILEIEQELQALGVNLGDFDKSNEFCTLKFALSENEQPKTVGVSFAHRCKVSFHWTNLTYFGIMIPVFFLLALAWLILVVKEKIQPIIKSWNQKDNSN